MIKLCCEVALFEGVKCYSSHSGVIVLTCRLFRNVKVVERLIRLVFGNIE